MLSMETQSPDCSIPHDGAVALAWSSDDSRRAGHRAMAQRGDEPESRPARDMVIAAWAVLSLGTSAVRAARLIPWWLFALVVLLVLAHP